MGFEIIKCPKCGSELVYSGMIGYPPSNKIYHEYDCTNDDCNYCGRILKGGYY